MFALNMTSLINEMNYVDFKNLSLEHWDVSG